MPIINTVLPAASFHSIVPCDAPFDTGQFYFDLVDFRHKKDLRWKEIAAMIGTTVKSIGTWKQGVIFPKVDAFLRACGLMEKDPFIYLKQPHGK